MDLFKYLPLLLLLVLSSCSDVTREIIEPGEHSVIIFDEDHLQNGVTVESLGDFLIAKEGTNEWGNIVREYGHLHGNKGLVRMKVRQNCISNEEDFGPTLKEVLREGNYVCYDVVGYREGANLWQD